jgi:hypothetical protein
MFERLIRDGRIVVPDEVMRELEKKGDGLVDWLKARDVEVFPSSTEVMLGVREVLAKYPKLLDTRKNRSGGDPFVIAVARRQSLVVVTGERFIPNMPPDRPRIPGVCDGMGVKWTNVLGVVTREAWVF